MTHTHSLLNCPSLQSFLITVATEPWHCFSVLLNSFSLDLCAPSFEVFATWFLGLQAMLRPERPRMQLFTKADLLIASANMKVRAAAVRRVLHGYFVVEAMDVGRQCFH